VVVKTNGKRQTTRRSVAASNDYLATSVKMKRLLSIVRCDETNYLERLLALLKTHWVRVLSTAAHGELDVDIETVGMTTVNVRRS